MFIGSHETAQRVLRGKYRGAVTLLTRRLQAGGPGSGCHGPNCGRPEGSGNVAQKVKKPHGPTAAGILKKMGWTLVPGQHNVRIPHWKKGVGDHSAHIYQHPKYGTIIVNHSGGFKHIDMQGNMPAKGSGKLGFVRLGKNAVRLQEYLNRLQNVGAQPKADVLPIGKPSASSEEQERYLSISPVSDRQENGRHGINESFIYKMPDGSKALFKPNGGEEWVLQRAGGVDGGEDAQTINELASWQVAKRVGMEDMVSPSVKRTLDGRTGVLIKWQPGVPAKELDYNRQFDGKEGLARAAVFDFVINALDRHDGNWVVEQTVDGDKLHLIDHGIAFNPQHRMLSYIGRYASRQGSFEGGKLYGVKPSDYARPYVDNKDSIMAALKQLGMKQHMVDGVGMRINKLEKMASWEELTL